MTQHPKCGNETSIMKAKWEQQAKEAAALSIEVTQGFVNA
jgi:hypothetical protein